MKLSLILSSILITIAPTAQATNILTESFTNSCKHKYQARTLYSTAYWQTWKKVAQNHLDTHQQNNTYPTYHELLQMYSTSKRWAVVTSYDNVTEKWVATAVLCTAKAPLYYVNAVISWTELPAKTHPMYKYTGKSNLSLLESIIKTGAEDYEKQ